MEQRTLPDLIGAPAEERDMPLIAEALAAEGLPTADLAEGGTAFFVFHGPGGGLIGAWHGREARACCIVSRTP